MKPEDNPFHANVKLRKLIRLKEQVRVAKLGEPTIEIVQDLDDLDKAINDRIRKELKLHGIKRFATVGHRQETESGNLSDQQAVRKEYSSALGRRTS